MANDLVEVYSMASFEAGGRHKINSVLESTREVEVLNLWYPTVRDWVMRAAFWPSIRAHARLALRKERDTAADWVLTDPAPEYLFSYAPPSDMLAPWHLYDFARFQVGQYYDGSSWLPSINTQTEDAILVYGRQETNVAAWDVGLKMAIVHGLAAAISLPLHGKTSRAQLAQVKANDIIREARAANANNENNLYDHVPDWISARGYAGSVAIQRFLYPYGPLLSILDDARVISG